MVVLKKLLPRRGYKILEALATQVTAGAEGRATAAASRPVAIDDEQP